MAARRNKAKILPAVEAPKSCLDCQHCYLYGGDSGDGEYTRPTPMEWTCTKGWWDIGRDDLDSDDVRRKIFVAQKCPDFEERPRMGGKA